MNKMEIVCGFLLIKAVAMHGCCCSSDTVECCQKKGKKDIQFQGKGIIGPAKEMGDKPSQITNLGNVRKFIQEKGETGIVGKISRSASPSISQRGKGHVREHSRLVEGFLEDIGNINKQDEQGKTELHRSVIAQEAGMVRILLGLNANLTIKDNSGKQAKDYAAEGSLIAQLLLGKKGFYKYGRSQRIKPEGTTIAENSVDEGDEGSEEESSQEK